MMTEVEWSWWASNNGELYSVGPCDTKEQAVAEGIDYFDGEPFEVAEACNPPLRISEWIGLDTLVERADERLYDSDRVSGEFDDSPIFEVTKEQEEDLIARIKKTCDEWQAEHNLVFTCSTFGAMRNRDYITPPDEEPEQEAS